MDEYEKDGERKLYRPIFEIMGHQSSTLRSSLMTGIVQDIELVCYERKDAGFDEYSYVKEEKEERQLVLQDAMKPNALVNFVNGLKGDQNYSKYDHMFIRIKDDEGKIKRTKIDPDTDFLENAFVQTEILRDFDKPLEQACDSIRSDILSKMFKIACRISGKVMEEDEQSFETIDSSVGTAQATVLSAD